MKVYTRMGDEGETSLLSGERVRKDHELVEAYGTVDELCSVLGVLRSESLPETVSDRLVEIQNQLFAVGSALADPRGRLEHDPGSWEVDRLETWIDSMDAELPPLAAFILPAGSRAASLTHVARVVCRRAERRALTASRSGNQLPPGIVRYLNRLSDVLFVLARYLNFRAGVGDTEWAPRRGGY
jgi:cob(I)alamin adenosyltransferase